MHATSATQTYTERYAANDGQFSSLKLGLSEENCVNDDAYGTSDDCSKFFAVHFPIDSLDDQVPTGADQSNRQYRTKNQITNRLHTTPMIRLNLLTTASAY